MNMAIEQIVTKVFNTFSRYFSGAKSEWFNRASYIPDRGKVVLSHYSSSVVKYPRESPGLSL